MDEGSILATLHANDETVLSDAAARVRDAFAIGDSAPPPADLIIEELR